MATHFALKFVSQRVGLKNHVVGVKNQGLGVYERGGMDDQDKPCMHIYMWACISHKPFGLHWEMTFELGISLFLSMQD
jgi:hypothetical protein